MGDGYDEPHAPLIAKAREALVQGWSGGRWDYWVTLEWRTVIHAATANAHLERLIRDLHRDGIRGHKHPTVRVVAGFHHDPYPHAHALVGLSRRHRAQVVNAAEFRDWLAHYWYHGPVFAAAYDPTRRHPEHGGAVEYLARDPGTVVWG